MSSLADIAQALREAEVVRVSLLHAFKPGDVVIVECSRPLSAEALAKTRAQVESILADTGIKIVVLGDALHVVAREEHTTVTPR